MGDDPLLPLTNHAELNSGQTSATKYALV